MIAPSTAQRLFDELQQAELAYRMTQRPHAAYLAERLRTQRYQGQTRSELQKIIGLGPKSKEFCDLFLKEFNA